MGNPRITIKGVKDVTKALSDIGDRVGLQQVRAILADAVDLIRQEAARNIQANIKSDTGNLLASLITREGKRSKPNAWTKAGGSVAPHAKLVEYGHHMVGHKPNLTDKGQMVQPHPFFRPALDSQRSAVRQRVIENLKALVENSPYTLSISADQIGARKPRTPKPRKP